MKRMTSKKRNVTNAVNSSLKMYYALEWPIYVIFYFNTYNNDEMALTVCTKLF